MKVRTAFFCLILLFSIFVFLPQEVIEADTPSVTIVINEIMYDPSGSDTLNEWVELFNNGSTSINMTNWVITDGEGGDDFFFSEIIVPPGDYVVIYTGAGTNETDFSDDVAHLYMNRTSVFLENSGDDVILKNATVDPVDYVAFDFGIYVDACPVELNWDDMNVWVDTEGNSISLHPNGIDRDSGLDWEESDPTPGKPNAHLNDLPPVISEVMHSPQNPLTSETVTISVNVTDDYALFSVLLNYSVDGLWVPPQTMTYDGSNYSLILPAHAEGTKISYHIIANDDAQQISLSDSFSFAHSDLPLDIVINEFLPSPLSDWNGDFDYDSNDEWIELYNFGGSVVNIGGWVIDDIPGFSGSSDPYTIPMGNYIEPGGFLVFFGNETGVVLNDFGGDNVTLLNENGAVIDTYHFSDTSDDTAQGRFPDGFGDWKNFLLPTPGEENVYPVDSLGNLSQIKINEFLPAPKGIYSKEWIELYNSGSTPVTLDGCYLDDITGGGTKPWQIPINTTILAGEVQVFEKSFGLNNAGDSVHLLYVDGITVIDSFTYDSSEYDISHGRGGDGEELWVHYSIPTPGESNTPFVLPDAQKRSIVITEVFYRSSEETEYVRLYNPADSPVDIGGWRIADGEHYYSGSVIFPEGSTIPSKGHVYIANTALVFFEVWGFYPDFEYGNSSLITQMIGSQGPSFAMQSDEVRLMDEFGVQIDILVYGDYEFTEFWWHGDPVPGANKGEYLKRNFNTQSNTYDDSNTARDWRHIRQYKMGQSDFDFVDFDFSGNVTVFSSPDSSYGTIIDEIEQAQDMILIGMYEFTNLNLSEKIIERLNQGVEVRILMEGSPVGGISVDQRYCLQKIHEAGGEVRFMVSNSSLGSRYRYLHGKYVIIDNSSVILSSENWKYTGVPIDNTYGNRGWGVVVRNSQVAEYFADVFHSDWDSVSYDIIPFTPDDYNYGNAPLGYEPEVFIQMGYYDPIFSSQTIQGDFKVSPVLAPDTTLLESDSILDMINSATDSIYIEQLDLPLSWDDGEEEYGNMYLAAVIEAAEMRGVDVKILLSSLYTFPDDPDLDNYDTFLHINDYAERHNLTGFLEARLVDYDRLGLSKVHNKGMIADGNRTLISSVNWNRNSVAQNREVGVIIENNDVANYFTEIFFWDWNEPPKADAGGDITVTISDSVEFKNSCNDSDDNIISYFWDFDDGTNSTEANPNHRFSNQSLYEVRLTVSDGQYSSTDIITVIVLEAEEDDVELGVVVYAILLITFAGIFIVIMAFIRQMRLRFL
jgi:phosphatidylserine/phosphatidylglycerophosphate/cardiolipin synthase-like enzyme